MNKSDPQPPSAEALTELGLQSLETEGLLEAPQQVLKVFRKAPDDLPPPELLRWTSHPVNSKYGNRIEQLSETDYGRYRDLHHKVVVGGSSPELNEIKWLKQLVAQYPDIPSLENLLANLWKLEGNLEKYRRINQEMMEKYPDYLFARTNLAEELLNEDKPELIPELLDHHYDLNRWDAEPQRLFHISEIAAFYSVVCRYCLLSARDLRAAWAFSLVYHSYAAHPVVPKLVKIWLELPDTRRQQLGQRLKKQSKLKKRRR